MEWQRACSKDEPAVPNRVERIDTLVASRLANVAVQGDHALRPCSVLLFFLDQINLRPKIDAQIAIEACYGEPNVVMILAQRYCESSSIVPDKVALVIAPPAA